MMHILTVISSAARVLLHLVAEGLLKYSHEHAVLAENLLMAASESSETTSQTNLSLATTRDNHAALKLKSYWKNELMQYLCLGFSPDLKWDTLPLCVRELLLQRCLGQTRTCIEGHKQLAIIVSSRYPELPWDVYLARYNYGALVAASSYRSYIESELGCDETKESYVQSSATSTTTLPKERFSQYRTCNSGWSSITHYTVGFIYHQLGTVMKFFAIAFVADAEYQRELNCILVRWPRPLQMVLRILLNSLWNMAKAAHGILLPFFLVSKKYSMIFII
jgi:hypothetical protein